MKRLTVFLTAFTILALMLSTTSTAFAADLINNSHEELPLLNPLANVQRVAGNDVQAVLQSENTPGIVLCDAAELDDIAAFLTACMEHGAVPTVSVHTDDDVNALVDALTASVCKDCTVISDDAALLKKIRGRKTLVRTGLIIAPENATLTSKEAADIRAAVRSAPATFCVIENGVFNHRSVAELQALAVAVWVTADSKVDIAAAPTAGANGIITDPAADTAALMNDWFLPNTMTRTPVMIGHRGNPTQAPENSLSGFIKAYENGADVIEVDVEITKDGEVVIMHDSTLNRTTDYDGDLTVNAMTLAQIKKYHLLGKDGSVTDEKVPTLREVLENFRGKDCRIFVEFKGNNSANVPAAAAIIKELDMEDRVDVISFSSDFLKSTQKEMVGMSTGYLQSPAGTANSPEKALETLFSSMAFTQAANSTINPNKSVATGSYFQAATDRGMTVWPWTYGWSSNNGAFLLCPDGVTTDDVQWAKDMYKSFDADSDKVSATVGKDIDLSLTATCYGGSEVTPSTETLSLTVVDGDDCVAIENGVLTATKAGKATVIVGCQTQTTTSSEYVLYTEPVTVTVYVVHPLWLIIGGGVVIAAAVILVIVLRRKKA